MTPGIEELKVLIKDEHRYFPLGIKLDMDHQSWLPLYKRLTLEHAYHIVLESGRAGRYSVMAFQPRQILYGKNGKLSMKEVDEQGRVLGEQLEEGKLLEKLRGWLRQRKAPRFPQLPPFCGGLIGFFSYDLMREIETLPQISEDDLETPDVYLLAVDRVLVYDHQEQQHWLIGYFPLTGQPENDYAEAQTVLWRWKEALDGHLDKLSRTPAETGEPRSTSILEETAVTELQTSLDEQQFIAAVQKIQQYIAAGDVFQVNLSVRQSRPLVTEPFRIYEALRTINPSPYMGYLHFPELQIVSGSPEQLVRVRGREITTRPIAGTRPRGENREQDLALARELIENEKERAEHVMLVDLERNDLGKVARYGTVQVDEFMVIEEYSHVMHIVSNVTGELAEGNDACDVIGAVFPGGTITGAPKVRTMEIIEELEPVRRGIYTGSIGWIDLNGDMELNIVIRTLLARDGQAYVQAGAGIVIDSVPANEFKESLSKAKALWKAYEQSRAKELTKPLRTAKALTN